MGIYKNKVRVINKKTGKFEKIRDKKTGKLKFKYRNSPYYSISWTDKKGIQHKEKTRLTSADDAREVLVEKLRAVKLMRHPYLKDDQKMTFAKFAEKFEKEFKGLRRRHRKFSESSRINYIGFMKKLVGHFGELNISEINESDVDEYISKRESETVRGLGKKKLSPCTINREVGTLRLALNWAVKIKIIGQNPLAEKLSRENLFDEKPREKYFYDEELSAVIATAREPWKKFILIGINTGMRLEEVLGLRWDEVDTKHAIITLPPERTKGNKGREVELNETMVDLFKALKMQRGESEIEYIFPSPKTGKPYVKTFSNTWKRLLKRAGIKRPLLFHDLRRTFITKAIGAGVGVKDVQEQVGHEDATTTLKNYAQATKAGKKRAVALVEVSEPAGELVELKKAGGSLG